LQADGRGSIPNAGRPLRNSIAKGIFTVKNAITPVADWLNISKYTVYLYIRQFRHEDFPEGEE